MPDTKKQVRPFAAILQEQRRGLTHSELSDGLAELAAAVIEHGKVGTLTLQLKLKPSGDGASVLITDTVSVKAPQGEREPAIFFADSEGNLTRTDPRQMELAELREVPRTAVRDEPQAAAEGGQA